MPTSSQALKQIRSQDDCEIQVHQQPRPRASFEDFSLLQMVNSLNWSQDVSTMKREPVAASLDCHGDGNMEMSLQKSEDVHFSFTAPQQRSSLTLNPLPSLPAIKSRPGQRLLGDVDSNKRKVVNNVTNQRAAGGAAGDENGQWLSPPLLTSNLLGLVLDNAPKHTPAFPGDRNDLRTHRERKDLEIPLEAPNEKIPASLLAALRVKNGCDTDEQGSYVGILTFNASSGRHEWKLMTEDAMAPTNISSLRGVYRSRGSRRMVNPLVRSRNPRPLPGVQSLSDTDRALNTCGTEPSLFDLSLRRGKGVNIDRVMDVHGRHIDQRDRLEVSKDALGMEVQPGWLNMSLDLREADNSPSQPSPQMVVVPTTTFRPASLAGSGRDREEARGPPEENDTYRMGQKEEQGAEGKSDRSVHTYQSGGKESVVLVEPSSNCEPHQNERPTALAGDTSRFTSKRRGKLEEKEDGSQISSREITPRNHKSGSGDYAVSGQSDSSADILEREEVENCHHLMRPWAHEKGSVMSQDFGEEFDDSFSHDTFSAHCGSVGVIDEDLNLRLMENNLSCGWGKLPSSPIEHVVEMSVDMESKSIRIPTAFPIDRATKPSHSRNNVQDLETIKENGEAAVKGSSLSGAVLPPLFSREALSCLDPEPVAAPALSENVLASTGSRKLLPISEHLAPRICREVPPKDPSKLCFLSNIPGCTHKEVLQSLESTFPGVKVATLQYDPVHLQDYRLPNIGTRFKCMWLFHLVGDSDPAPLLARGMRLRGQRMRIRRADDAYEDERRSYSMYWDMLCRNLAQGKGLNKKSSGYKNKKQQYKLYAAAERTMSK